MAKTIEQLKVQSAEVKDASVIGENTATRVGSLFNDIVEHVEAYEAGQAQKDTEQSASINAETTRATAAETTLSERINQEVSDRKSMDETIGVQLSNEIERAKKMELGISTKLDDEIKRAQEAENDLQEQITSEAEARDLAINAESQARTQNDQLLSQAIAAEQERAEAAEQANATAINTQDQKLSELDEEVKNLDAVVLGSATETSVDYVQNYEGTLALGAPFPTRESSSSGNQCMRVSIEGKDWKSLKATLGHASTTNENFCAIAFEDSSGRQIKDYAVRYASPTEEGVYTYRVAIPGDAVAVWLFNRRPLNQHPLVSFYSERKEGLVNKVINLDKEVKETSKKIDDFGVTTTEIEIVDGGYINASGAVIAVSAKSWNISKSIEVSEGNYIDYYLDTYDNIPYVACYNRGVYVAEKSLVGSGSEYTKKRGTFIVPEGVTHIRLCTHYFVDKYAKIKVSVIEKLESLLPYKNDIEGYSKSKAYILTNVLSKPYTFNGKKAIFFGDSITWGFTKAGNVTSEKYPKLFSNAVGMEHSNKAVGGAAFCDPQGQIPDHDTSGGTILNQINGVTLTGYDYVFIAAGTNDQAIGATLANFESAVRETFNAIQAQGFAGKVIIITPINKTRVDTKKIAELDEYRNLLTRIACEYEYDVVNGKEFPFPTNKGAYESVIFGDDIHPSELGYRVYARMLRTILCS